MPIESGASTVWRLRQVSPIITNRPGSWHTWRTMPKSDSDRHPLMPLSSRFGDLHRPRPNRAVVPVRTDRELQQGAWFGVPSSLEAHSRNGTDSVKL